MEGAVEDIRSTDEDMLIAKRVYREIVRDYGSMEAAAKAIAAYRRCVEERVAATFLAAIDVL